MQRESKRFFKQINGSELEFLLFLSKNPYIQIQITSITKCERYSLVINGEYLNQLGPDFPNALKSISLFYEFICEQINNFTIEDGTIIIKLEFMLDDRMQIKDYRLAADKEVLSINQRVLLSIQQVKYETKLEFAKRDLQIAALKAQNINLKRSNESLKIRQQKTNKQVSNFIQNTRQEVVNSLKKMDDLSKVCRSIQDNRNEDRAAASQQIEKARNYGQIKLTNYSKDNKTSTERQWALTRTKFMKCMGEIDKMSNLTEDHSQQLGKVTQDISDIFD